MKEIKNTAVFASASLLLAVSARTSSIQDGGFESPAYAEGTYVYLSPGVVGVPTDPSYAGPWAFEGGAGILHPDLDATSAYYSFANLGSVAYEGDQFAFLQGVGSGTSQSILLSGGEHRLDFAQQGRIEHPSLIFGGNLTYQVLLDSGVLGTFTSTSSSPWESKSLVFSASAGNHTLSFQVVSTPQGSPGDQTVFLDAVSLSAVPDSSSCLADLGVLGLLGVFARRNRL